MSTHDPVDMIPISLLLWASGNIQQITTLLLNSLPFILHTHSLSNRSISQEPSVKSNLNALLEILVCLVEKKKHVKPFSNLHEESKNKSFLLNCSSGRWCSQKCFINLFLFAFYTTGFRVVILP